MAGEFSGPDAAKVHTIADLARELGLLRARAALGTYKARVSLEALAGRIGEPRSTVHAYVSGKHLPPSTVLDRIVIALGATPDEQRQWGEAWFRVAGSQESTRQAKTPMWTNPAPRQLPPATPGFCGRRPELDRLDQLRTADPTMVISALAGGGGVGKTALAIHWAHRVAGDFPDGQLWVDLRGFDQDAPLDPAVALSGFLRALGVPPEEVPTELEGRSALYRTVVSGRRVLILLDNASGAEQVRPLLPGAPGCLVIVTSRDRLTGLVARDGAQRIDLDVLPEADALALLRRLIGGRVDADPDAASALVRRCAALPLALRIAAEWAISHPSMALCDLAAELADERRLLDLFDAGGDPRTAIRAVFSWSTRHLDAAAAIAFRRLGQHPGQTFDAPTLSALLDTSATRANSALLELARSHLIQPSTNDRYFMHDLVHAFALERAEHDDPEPERAAALDRLAHYYLGGAVMAMDLLYPHAKHQQSYALAPPAFDGEAAARAWLDSETAAMLTLAGRLPHQAIAFAITLRRHLETICWYPEALRLHETALNAAVAAADQAAQAVSLINASRVHARTGRYPLATEHLERAVKLCRATGDQAELSRALDDLGTVHGRTGQFPDAANNFAEALALCRRLGDTDGEARALHNLGTVHGITGDYAAAESCFQDALELCRDLGDPLGEAYAVDNLGSVYCRVARYAESVECHERALTLRREHGDRLGTAHALDNLGTAYRCLGRYREALGCHEQSLTLRRDIGDLGDEPHALNNLGITWCLLDEPDQAIPLHHLALAQCRHTGNRYEQARAHDGLGVAHLALGDAGQAREHWLDALAIYYELGVPETATVQTRLSAL